MTRGNAIIICALVQGICVVLAYDPRDLAGFLNPVAPPAPAEAEMFCPGLCNPICSPTCTRSCCYNAPRSSPHWENMPAPNYRNYGMQMNARRSKIPDPTKEPTQSVYGCESKQLSIKCKNRSNKLVIVNSFYGRDDTKICRHPVLPYEAYCRGQEDLILEKVQNLCNGENGCSIAVKDGLLLRKGTVLCPNIYKYLKVDYICTQHPDIYQKALEK